MRASDIARLVALGAIWGASFIFIRVLAPVIGPVSTAGFRVLLGGAVLVAYLLLARRAMALRRYGWTYLLVGVTNSAIPFVLFGYAALHLPASYLGILNSCTPIFASLLAAVWLGEGMSTAKLAGLVAGCAGVALVSGAGPVTGGAQFAGAVAASLLAAFCYAASGIYLKRRASGAPPLALAGWSQLAAALVVLPAVAAPSLAPRWSAFLDPIVVLNVAALACICSSLAYALYFRLMQDVGPTRTLTVTYLIPLFGMVWASLFLHERVTLAMIAGCALIIAGTLTVIRPATTTRAKGPARVECG